MSHALSHLSGDEYRDRTGTIHASLLKEKLNGTFKAEAETAKIKLPKGFIPEFEMRPSAPAQLVKKTLPLRGTGLGIGQSGAGKTVVFLDLACATATGEPFFGREVRNQGGVVYIAVEGAGGFSNRVKAAKIHRGINGAIPLVVKAGAYNLKNDNELDPLIRELQQASAWFQQEYGVPLRLTIIDTMSAACALQNENDNAEVADVCKRLQRIDAETGAFCLGIHHAGKNPDAGARGASAWRANVDNVFAGTADRNETTGECTNRCLFLSKYRTGRKALSAGTSSSLSTLVWTRTGRSSTRPPLSRPT